MHTKLTLRLETGLIEQAKGYAAQKGKSVSQMVSEYFSMIARSENTETSMPPITAKLRGILAGYEIDANDYKRHLEERYL